MTKLGENKKKGKQVLFRAVGRLQKEEKLDASPSLETWWAKKVGAWVASGAQTSDNFGKQTELFLGAKT